MSRQSDAFIDALDGIATEYNAELQNLAAEEEDRDVPLRMADDPVLQQASRISSVLVHHHPDFPRVVAAFHGDDSLAPLHPKEGYLDPMILHPGGGIRVNAETVVRGLLASAAQRIYFYGLDWDAGVMQAAVADGVVQLRRAVRGEAISVYYLTGFDGLTLPADREVDTPWGKLRATPKAPPTSAPIEPRSQQRFCPTRLRRGRAGEQICCFRWPAVWPPKATVAWHHLKPGRQQFHRSAPALGMVRLTFWRPHDRESSS
jgi:hypothetical protein